MSEEYKNGFNDGYQFSIDNWDPKTGGYFNPFPESFCHRAGVYNCGFGEGLISGRSIVIEKTFGPTKSISWKDGNVSIVK